MASHSQPAHPSPEWYPTLMTFVPTLCYAMLCSALLCMVDTTWTPARIPTVTSPSLGICFWGSSCSGETPNCVKAARVSARLGLPFSPNLTKETNSSCQASQSMCSNFKLIQKASMGLPSPRSPPPCVNTVCASPTSNPSPLLLCVYK